MKLSDKAQAALDQVVARFQSGDLGPIIELARLKISGDTPMARWSFCNQGLVYALTHSLDCRGYRQWQEVGRQVQQGARAAYILVPLIKTKTDPATGQETTQVYGFRTVPVFSYEVTDGDECSTVSYEPAALPPLLDAAQALGIDVSWTPLGDALGKCSVDGQRVKLGTHDAFAWFHELAHAAHARLNGRLKAGQDTDQETVTDFTAVVLAALYNCGDYTGHTWDYIQRYHPDPLTAITRAVSTVEQVLELLETVTATAAAS
ncbi:MAG: M48 family peptidase [Chloroflexi bacterium]|nr:M48 family peptidase [Chloroflexota bacterium]